MTSLAGVVYRRLQGGLAKTAGRLARPVAAPPTPVEISRAPAFVDRLARHLDLSEATIRRAEAAAANGEAGVGRTLLALGLVEERAFADAAAALLGHPRYGEAMLPAAPILPDRLPAAFLKHHRLLPLSQAGGRIAIATADPEALLGRQAARLATGCAIDPVIATPAEIDAGLAALYQPRVVQATYEAHEADADRLRDMSSDAPVVRFVGRLLAQAVDRRASDIHLEPMASGMRIRLRVDGRMVETEAPPAPLGPAVRSRLKLLAGMDIAEARLPQDGRIETVARGRPIDLRVATLPTAGGREAMTIRVLDRRAVRFDFAALGFEEADVARLRALARGDHGTLLVTGPTGSGKTTTLYTLVNDFEDSSVKIVTVEDPVEYAFDGIIQVQVHKEIDLDFATVLRASLRHNPDVLLVGEIRDRETAQVAVQASLTGHVVLATLHTNSAAATVARLVDMGVDPYLVGATLTGVVAQRLVPLLCTDCRMPDPLSAAMLARMAPDLGDAQPMRAPGCRSCGGSGTSGRAVIYELLEVDEALAAAIAGGQDLPLPPGFRSMERHALERAARGECALGEALRLVRQPG